MFYLTLCNCIPEGVTGFHRDLCPVLNVSFEKTQLTVWFNLLPSYGSSKLNHRWVLGNGRGLGRWGDRAGREGLRRDAL